MVEASLAAQLQVSRTPIRDALRRLESDGLLDLGKMMVRLVLFWLLVQVVAWPLGDVHSLG